jgi:putative transposase
MGRSLVTLQSDFPYNISARCINRDWFNLDMNIVWEIFCEELNRVIENKKLVVHSFVLMSNHFHLIASTPESNISECMHQFMQRTSRSLTRKGNRINETFAGRHHKCILGSYSYYLNAYKYNYRNPVAAKICEKVEDYSFGTLKGLLNPKEKRINICEDPLLLNRSQTLDWLNKKPEDKKLEAVKLGLRRAHFKSGKCRKNGRAIILPNEII